MDRTNQTGEIMADLLKVADAMPYREGHKDVGVWKGKPFWIGACSTLDGQIEEVYTYAEAEAVDFQHKMLFSPEILDREPWDDDDPSPVAVFWLEADGDIKSLRQNLTPAIKQRIKEQITSSRRSR